MPRYNVNKANPSDYINKKYSELTIISFEGQDDKSQTLVKCLCDCGNRKILPLYNVKSGRTNNCGCKKTTKLSKLHPNIYPKTRGTYAQHAIAYYKAHAKRRGYEWSLDSEEAYNIMLQTCYYCGTSPFGKLPHLGIDRINNTIVYVTGNCVTCCGICNVAKQTMNINETNYEYQRILCVDR